MKLRMPLALVAGAIALGLSATAEAAPAGGAVTTLNLLTAESASAGLEQVHWRRRRCYYTCWRSYWGGRRCGWVCRRPRW